MKTNKNNININIANLKKSNVLIFSNTYIVGLKYDKEITSAPIVTYLSKKIKETEKFAQDLSISIIKNNIADKIVSILDIGDEIPVSLYLPIAQIYASILTKNEIEFSELLNDEVFDSIFASGLCIEFAPDLYKKMMKLAITTKLEKLRKKIIADLGLVIIPIKINKNLSLAQGKYFIKLNRDILLESDLSDSITNFSTIVINDLKCVILENAGKLLSRRQVLAILEKLNSIQNENGEIIAFGARALPIPIMFFAKDKTIQDLKHLDEIFLYIEDFVAAFEDFITNKKFYNN
jgi:type III secretion system FlhB-like substrate exporter